MHKSSAKLTGNEMPVLRISHTAAHVEAALEGNGPRQIEKRPFSFTLSSQDAEDIRWYLEEYPIYPVDPQAKTARRIGQRMDQVGRELFSVVLGGSDLWHVVRRSLGQMRIEVETELADTLVPWELMRDLEADQPLALEVASFVRCHSRPARNPHAPAPTKGKIRILLAICRLQDDGVPFRSVARHLIRGLSDAAREPFHLEVLRPPTFEQLARRLRVAKAQGEPFHIVHFDGHGLAGEVFFENPELERNRQPVKADELGNLLHETGVPLLILNACRSADSEPLEQPEKVSDLHRQIRQFGSFAHAVMDCGATGVVAWRYSVFVDTAARYMADLYAALASGIPLGEAATLARKQLSSRRADIPDWTVPIIFETSPVRLFPQAKESFTIDLGTRPAADVLPQAPDIGFIGRDDTILKLDRAFDEQNIVLLHAYAGSGKTSTAVEFARWYKQTGGLTGPVVFTSFEQHRSLPRVLDDLGRAFESMLAKSKIQWLTLDGSQQREVALQILRQIPVLWIWDNVERIAGFPSGSRSSWSATEQYELANFLRAARGTKAKFLLTSRRDERDWLHDLPAPIELPPMQFAERLEMTEKLAKKRGRRLDDVEDWRPLIWFTQGNPLTLTVVVGQALRDVLKSRDQIESFVRKLQAGEAVFEDEASEGRTRSLAASLSYGFEHAFTEVERMQLALLHLFHGFVNADVLRTMGHPEAGWCLPCVKDMTREVWITLLDRAAEVGLLTALGQGFYLVHPALPWFFHQFFERHYAETRMAATRAFVGAMADRAEGYFLLYDSGKREAIAGLAAESANLLHAQRLARINGWWNPMLDALQGLSRLYQHTGRTTDWSRLIEEVAPDFVNPATGGPLPDKEEVWALLTGYRVQLARHLRRWKEAERLHTPLVHWIRQRAVPILSMAPQMWSAADKQVVRFLVASLHEISDIQREQGLASCVEYYREALSLAEAIQDNGRAAACEYNLGRSYEDLPEIRDLALAEQWYRRSLERHAKQDSMGRARCLIQLGNVEYRRFLEAVTVHKPAEETRQYLLQTALCYEQALDLLPVDAPHELAAAHRTLGQVYPHIGQIDIALGHCRESIRCCEAMGDPFSAGLARVNAARALGSAGRFADARDWAQSALRDFQASENADREITETLKLLEQIESDLQGTPPPSSEHPLPPH